jgi:hypothetical protein
MTSLRKTTRTADSTGDLHAGIDENGLGPLLGPLLVTGALAEVFPGADVPTAFAQLAARAGDSKALVDFHGSALGEAWARALLLREGRPAATPAALFDALLVEARDVREARCPSAAARQRCLHDDRPFDASDAAVEQALRDLEHLEKQGVRLRRFRAHSLCVAMLNDAFRSGVSRFSADLRAMELLLLDFHGTNGGPISAICGKVGGYEKYEPQFHHLATLPRTTLFEKREESRYEFGALSKAAPGSHPLGTVSFLRDADATAPLVGLASLVGKYLRDRMMRTIALYHLADATAVDPTILAAPSGYHDPVTKRFVAATAAARAATALPENCFLRAGKEEKPPKASNAKKGGSPKASLPLFTPPGTAEGGEETATKPR